MTERQKKIAAGIVLAFLFTAFLYKPALFGFYGFTQKQCVFLYAVDAPTAMQARAAIAYCGK